MKRVYSWRCYCFSDDMAEVNVLYIIPQYEVQMNLDTPKVLKKRRRKTCPINISCLLAVFVEFCVYFGHKRFCPYTLYNTYEQ